MRKLLIGSCMFLLLCGFATQAGAISIDYNISWEDERIGDLKDYLEKNNKIFNTQDFKASISQSGPDNIISVEIHYNGSRWLSTTLPFEEPKVVAIIAPDLQQMPVQPIDLPLSLDNGNMPPAAAPVPEPATLLLLGSGLIGVVSAGRKKIKK